MIGESIKKLPDKARRAMPETDVSGPARLRDLIAHRYFALDAEIVWEVATTHVPRLLSLTYELRRQMDDQAPGTDESK